MPLRAQSPVLLGLVASALTTFAEPIANAQEQPAEAAVEPPPPVRKASRDGARGFVEARGTYGTYGDLASGNGLGLGLAGGLAWGWIDLGIAGSYASLPTHAGDRIDIFGVGPELATRTWLGGPATLRLAVDPQYRSMREAGASTGLLGADLLAQFLFTISEETTPAWRLGVGGHVGRFWELGTGDRAYWTAGVDVVVRSWW